MKETALKIKEKGNLFVIFDELFRGTNVKDDSELIDEKPVYTYQLMTGVSHERLGMLIVKNEKIIEILNSISDTE